MVSDEKGFNPLVLCNHVSEKVHAEHYRVIESILNFQMNTWLDHWNIIPILILFAFDQQFKKSCMHCSIYFLFWPNVTQKLSCGPQSTRQEFFTDVADPVASHYKIIQSAHFFGHNFIHKV